MVVQKVICFSLIIYMLVVIYICDISLNVSISQEDISFLITMDKH